MSKTIPRTIATAAAFVIAALAFAQSADKNTAGPTANQLQLRLLEPAEGATISGSQVRITIGYNRTTFGQGQGTKFGEPNFPHPIFDVFLDNDLKQSLKGGESNVATIDNVPEGDHKIVVMAKNISGEVIDRKEIRVRTTAMAASATDAAATVPAPAAPPAPADTTMTQETTGTMASAPPPASRPEPAMAQDRDELPATASAHPRLALMGLGLVLAGVFLARRGRR